MTRSRRTCVFSKYTRQHSGSTRLFWQVSHVTELLHIWFGRKSSWSALWWCFYSIWINVRVERPLTVFVWFGWKSLWSASNGVCCGFAGESVSVIKHCDPIPDPRAVNQDKKNMLFSVSTYIQSDRWSVSTCIQSDRWSVSTYIQSDRWSVSTYIQSDRWSVLWR